MSADQTLQAIPGVLPAPKPEGRAASLATAHAAAQGGLHAEEFERLVREHQRRIFRLLVSLTRDPDAADTLTQECFLRAFEKRATFRGEASVGTWLVRIAVNLARDHQRNRKRAFWSWVLGGRRRDDAALAAEMLAVADTGASPEQAAAARQELAAVWAAADELAPQQRAVFLLRFAQEMSLQEIADALELEVGTVKAHLARAVGAVRRRFAVDAVGASAGKRQP